MEAATAGRADGGINAPGTDAFREAIDCARRSEVAAGNEAGSSAPLFRKLDPAPGIGTAVLIRPEGCKRFCCRPPDATTLDGSGGRLCCPYPDCAKLLKRI